MKESFSNSNSIEMHSVNPSSVCKLQKMNVMYVVIGYVCTCFFARMMPGWCFNLTQKKALPTRPFTHIRSTRFSFEAIVRKKKFVGIFTAILWGLSDESVTHAKTLMIFKLFTNHNTKKNYPTRKYIFVIFKMKNPFVYLALSMGIIALFQMNKELCS
jgi:hypothetical protein